MNLQNIQSEIFRQLVGIESLLKPEYGLLIDRYPSQRMGVMLWDIVKQDSLYNARIDPHEISTADQITAEITRIWNYIPAECKKEK